MDELNLVSTLGGIDTSIQSRNVRDKRSVAHPISRWERRWGVEILLLILTNPLGLVAAVGTCLVLLTALVKLATAIVDLVAKLTSVG